MNVLAAIDLLGAAGWLSRADLQRDAVRVLPGYAGGPLARIDWDELGGLDLPGSVEARAILEVAAGLAAGIPVDLRAVLAGLSPARVRLVLDSLAAAGGAR